MTQAFWLIFNSNHLLSGRVVLSDRPHGFICLAVLFGRIAVDSV